MLPNSVPIREDIAKSDTNTEEIVILYSNMVNI